MWPDYNYLYLALFLVCLLFSAFFSSAETAFLTLQRLRLRHLADSGSVPAQRITKLVRPPDRLLGTILIGNNLVNTAAAALGTLIAVSVFGEGRTALLVATFAGTFVILLLGEITPKSITIRHAERIASLYVRPMEFLTRIMGPLAQTLSWLGSAISFFARAPKIPKFLVSEEEINTILNVGVEEGAVEKSEAEMVKKFFKFKEYLVRELMVPRTDIMAVEKNTNLENFLAVYAQNPFSRFPVYEESLDSITGILWIKDVLRAYAQGSVHDDSAITSLVRPAYFVPETKPVDDLFAEMQAKGYAMAIVVDEYGGTAGLVTMDQLVEEIVGTIADELGRTPKDYEAIDEYTFQVDGAMRIGEANEEMNLNLPEGEYETVAGFVLHRLGHIPKEGTQFKHENLRLVVTEMKGRKVEKVLITREEKGEEKEL